jgi:hypothetical protein
MEIANMMQDEVIRLMNADDYGREDGNEEEEADKYDQTTAGVFYHAWFAQGKGIHVYMIHAQNPVVQEAVPAIYPRGKCNPADCAGSVLRGERAAAAQKWYTQV